MSDTSHTRRIVVHPRKGNRQYLLWCDESDSKGKLYSNFFGGVLVKSDDMTEVYQTLLEACNKLHFNDEIKWHKVSDHYLGKYQEVMDVFFELVKKRKIKVRIMFTQKGSELNSYPNKKAESFFRLYYLFIRDAFGFEFSGHEDDVYLRLYFDNLSTSPERRNSFIDSIYTLGSQEGFQRAKIKINKADIVEVDSKQHLLLQLLDVILGSMAFRLNHKHEEFQTRGNEKSNRTIAKEKLYHHILKNIHKIKSGFDIEQNLVMNSNEDSWLEPYRHWVIK